jgi:hypothetical protein
VAQQYRTVLRLAELLPVTAWYRGKPYHAARH